MIDKEILIAHLQNKVREIGSKAAVFGIFVCRNAEKFVPLHCQKKRRRTRAGHAKLALRTGKIFSLTKAQKRCRE